MPVDLMIVRTMPNPNPHPNPNPNPNPTPNQVRTMPYSLQEIVQILAIRAQVRVRDRGLGVGPTP